MSDVTVEKLGALLEHNPLGLLLVRDELAAWIGGFDRYAPGGKGSDQPTWLSMNDAASVIIDRKTGKQNYFIERAAVSVLGGIQPGTLTRVFGAAEREAGLLARVLLTYPPDKPALWTDAGLPDDVAAEWQNLLESLLKLTYGADEDGNPKPRFIPIGNEAKAVWIAWHDTHVRETADIDDDDLAAHHAKLKGVCVRFALLFECVAVATGGGAAACIGLDAMRRAIAVTEWCKAEAKRVYALLCESGAGRANRRLVEWIRGRDGTVTAREVARNLRSFKGDSKAARLALDDLVAAGLGSWTETEPTKSGGRPTKRFHLADTADADKTPRSATESERFVGVGAVGTPETIGDPPSDDGQSEATIEAPEAPGDDGEPCPIVDPVSGEIVDHDDLLPAPPGDDFWPDGRPDWVDAVMDGPPAEARGQG